jgi:FkbM family methyltransferase
MYAQNNEDDLILRYFGGHKGKVLDIGANDGQTFSNSRLLIENGWEACLIEPSPAAYEKLDALYKGNKNVYCLNVAIGLTDGNYKFQDSGSLLGEGDTSLVSTLVNEETKRWGGRVAFNEIEVEVMTYRTFSELVPMHFDVISIDAEGMDLAILRQINLRETRMVIVEFNGIDPEKYIDYCANFGLSEFHRNGENLIFAK